MSEAVTNSAPLAGNWSLISSVQLDVDLRMSSTDLCSSLIGWIITKQRTTESFVYTTGTLWMRYSPLLRWVSWDFLINNPILYMWDREFSRYFALRWLFRSPSTQEEYWLENSWSRMGMRFLLRRFLWWRLALLLYRNCKLNLIDSCSNKLRVWFLKQLWLKSDCLLIAGIKWRKRRHRKGSR